MFNIEKKKMYGTGDILSISGGFYQHYMIVVGPNLVVHASKENGVILANLSDVVTGKNVINHGRHGELPDSEIIRRATNMIGMSYNLFLRNCEHVVRHASGIKVESPQIQSAVACVLLVGAVFVIHRRFA